MGKLIDATLGRVLRHFFFVVIRTYYTLFFNISISGKRLLQDAPGHLILATHVSRNDGPIIATVLYSTTWVRPIVHHREYYNVFQWFPMFVASAIPVSSPSHWPADRRAARKAQNTARILSELDAGHTLLLFPAGKARRQPEEIVPPHYSGAYDILTARPDTPVMLLRIAGLGRFQERSHDNFYQSFGRRKGRRHVQIDIRPLTGLDPSEDIETFNAKIEALLNAPISHAL